ncbi:MAG: substrate-binding domain-containing protein, partial [Acidobacteria bacterium]|nr:substrate-binding domain-containing protein [Acidobacteriota bacterium]
YAFGYVELVFAAHNKMAYGAVKNPSGVFVTASIDSVTAAATADAKTLPTDFRASITNAPGAASYPISSFTWLLLPTVSRDAAKAKALTGFLAWMLDHGEGEAAAQYYAPLPKQVQDAVRKATAQIR